MNHVFLCIGLFLLILLVACTPQGSSNDPTLQTELNSSNELTILKRVEETVNNSSKLDKTTTPNANNFIKKSAEPTSRQSVTMVTPSPTFFLMSRTASPTPTGFQSGDSITPSADIYMPAMEQYVQIFGPGNGSHVTSPIQIQARIASEKGRVLRIELRGQDGRLLARLIKIPNVFPWHTADISLPVVFEINHSEEQGYLSISMDDEAGRTVAVNSIEITLLKDAKSELMPNLPYQGITIQHPVKDAVIMGKTIVVDGLLEGEIRSPVYVKLITSSGSILAHRQATVHQEMTRESQRFSAEIPFQVTSETPVLLIVYTTEGHGIEIGHLSSVEITLFP